MLQKIVAISFCFLVVVGCDKKTAASHDNENKDNNSVKAGIGNRKTSQANHKLKDDKAAKDARKQKYSWLGNRDCNSIYDGYIKVGRKKYHIRMMLTPPAAHTGIVRGRYCYKKQLKDIWLTGDLHDDKLLVNEYDQNGKLRGQFVFQRKSFEDSRKTLKGVWINCKNKKEYPVVLSLSYGGLNFGGCDKHFENLAAYAQAAVVNYKPRKFADICEYPLHTHIGTIKNKLELIRNFYKIFPRNLIKKIKISCPKMMFSNYRGVCFGGGIFWINSNCKIRAINNTIRSR